MKNNKRQAFTIVELVIVIAVIAILSAVLIPTFGSIIKSANIAADQAEAASVTTHLGMNLKGIKTEADIYNAIKEAYGQDKADTFAPRSAQYGYHYWYDIENNSIILATYKQIENKIATPDNKSEGEGEGAMLTSAVVPVANNDTFAINEKNSFRMFFDKYYIIDNGGSVVGEALNALRTGDDVATKVQALTEVGGFDADDLEDMANALLEKIKTVAIVTNEMTYVYNADSVTSFYFAPGITTISGNVVSNKNYVAKAENFTDEIVIPDTVTKVEQGALMFDVAGAKLQTSLADLEAVSKVFHADSTNATIIAGTDNCTINGGTVTNGSESLDLEYSNKVTSFAIAHPANGSDSHYDGATNTLYVAHNATLSLGAINFEATLDDNTVNTGVIWSVSDGAPFTIDGEGNVTINVPDKFDGNFNYEGTITATSVTNSEATAEIKVSVVTMMSAVVKIGENQLALNNTDIANTLSLTYDGTEATQIYAISGFTAIFTSESIGCCSDVKPTFTTSGDLFTIDDDKLTLNKDAENLNGTQTFTVKVGNHIEKNFTVTVVDNSATTFEKLLTNDYLYRVGNSNNITLGQLFKSNAPGDNISVAIYDASKGETKTVDELTNNHLTATYTKTGLTSDTWASSTIDFGGTGVAIIKITNNSGTQTAIVEVVEGYNVTAASQLKSNANNILLADIKLASGGSFSLTGDAINHKTLYGNGFTFDITEATSKGNGIINLTNADIDNIKIVGSVYETYQDTHGGSNPNEYYASAVFISGGNCRISNSYIFGCRSNVRVNSNLEIVDTVLDCARFSNVNLTAGTLTIDGLTTINEPRENNNVVGFGIAIGNDAGSTSKIVIKGELTQHNWLCEADESYLPNVIGMSTLVDTIFAETKYLHDIGGTNYVNMGIACLTDKVAISAVTYSDPYEATTISKSGFTGFIITIADAEYDATADDLVHRTDAYAWVASKQSNTIPTLTWSNYSSGTTDVSFERGQSAEFDPNVLTASKHGNTLTPSITINGVDYTGKTITFTEDQTCTIKYTIKDSYVYDANGSVIAAEEYVYYLVVNVTTTDPTIKAPEFSFTGATGTTTVVVGDKTYVVPTGNTSDTTKFFNVGNGIYAPIVEVAIKDNTSDFTGYYPIFGGISITWYDTSSNSTTYNSSSNLTALPSGLEWITEVASLKGAVTDWDGYDKYSSSGLCRVSKPDGSTNKNDTYKLVEFSFQAEGTEKYYYYIRFKEPAHTCPSGCITEGTLITMADGTQKPVEDLSVGDMVLAFNHETGKFVATPLIFNSHANDLDPRECDVLHLQFSNGEELEIVESHGLFDMTLMKYVYLDYENYTSFIGHKFYYAGKDGTSSEHVTLENAYIETEITRVFCPVTYFNMNSIANGFLNAPNSPYGIAGPVNYFDYDPDLKYNQEAMQRDIEKYGLYTYNDFKDYISEEAYNSSTAVYLKVAEGKGLLTFEEILIVINYLLEGSLIN